MGTTAIDFLRTRELRLTHDGISVCASKDRGSLPVAPRRLVSRRGRDFRDGRLRRQPAAGDRAAVARQARGRTTPSLDDRAGTGVAGSGTRSLGLVLYIVPEPKNT